MDIIPIPTELEVGDIIKIKISDSYGSSTREATVIQDSSSNQKRILLALSSPYNGDANSHNAIWETPERTKAANLFGYAGKKNISWWFDERTIILQLLAKSPKELPCRICKRKNFLFDSVCWWCGQNPFNR